MAPVGLLDLARATLDGSHPDRNRMALWLARAAFEDTVTALLGLRCVDAAGAQMRSKLTCLQVAYADTGLPARCDYLWSRLSEACHQHAYQLSPTHTESLHLIALVASLIPHPSLTESTR